MPEQNSYQMSANYKNEQGWSGWTPVDIWSGDTWQDAIKTWLLDIGWWRRPWSLGVEYTVVSETPSEDGRSGILVTQFDPTGFNTAAKIKATIIDA